MRRLVWSVCVLVALAASPLASQAPAREDVASATLCMIEWSIGPIWAGASVGCPPVVQPLQAPNRPCRRRYSTSEGSREEARLDYDADGRLREVEHVGRGRAAFAYDPEGRLTSHARRSTAYPASTTSYTYTAGARAGDYTISADTPPGDDGYRWRVEADRIVSTDSTEAGVALSIARALFEGDVFAGVETTLCTRPSSSPSCEPSGQPSRTHITRDRLGRIASWSNEDIVRRYTYDARGRLTRVRTESPRLRDDLRVDYVCARAR